MNRWEDKYVLAEKEKARSGAELHRFWMFVATRFNALVEEDQALWNGDTKPTPVSPEQIKTKLDSVKAAFKRKWNLLHKTGNSRLNTNHVL